MAGWVLYCIALVTSGDWTSRYEAWNIRVAFGSIIRKRCKTGVLYPEIRESTNQKSSKGDSAYSDPELLRDYIRVRPDAFRLPSNAGYVARTELAQAREKYLCEIMRLSASVQLLWSSGCGFNPQALRHMGRFQLPW